jgi:hypothetical protein
MSMRKPDRINNVTRTTGRTFCAGDDATGAGAGAGAPLYLDAPVNGSDRLVFGAGAWGGPGWALYRDAPVNGSMYSVGWALCTEEALLLYLEAPVKE